MTLDEIKKRYEPLNPGDVMHPYRWEMIVSIWPEIPELLEEVAVCRERLGPAGYKILEEHKSMRETIALLRTALETAEYGFRRIENRMPDWSVEKMQMSAKGDRCLVSLALAAIERHEQEKKKDPK